jgi:hypothetical protein
LGISGWSSRHLILSRNISPSELAPTLYVVRLKTIKTNNDFPAAHTPFYIPLLQTDVRGPRRDRVRLYGIPDCRSGGGTAIAEVQGPWAPLGQQGHMCRSCGDTEIRDSPGCPWRTLWGASQTTQDFRTGRSLRDRPVTAVFTAQHRRAPYQAPPRHTHRGPE